MSRILLLFLGFNAFVFSVCGQHLDTKVLSLDCATIKHLAATDQLLVITRSNQENGNSLCWIDPYFGLIDTCIALGSQPHTMAVSADESLAYISLPNMEVIVVVDLGAKMVVDSYTLGQDTEGTNYYAKEILCLTDDPDRIIVSRGLPDQQTVSLAVLQQGQLLPETATDSCCIFNIAHDPQSGHVFASDWEHQDTTAFRRFALTGDGIQAQPYFVPHLYGDKFNLVPEDRQLYSGAGVVYSISDTGTLTSQGYFQYLDHLVDNPIWFGGSYQFASEPDTNLVYMLSWRVYWNSYLLSLFNKENLELVELDGFVDFYGGAPLQMIKWGEGKKLAFIIVGENWHPVDGYTGRRLVITRPCQPGPPPPAPTIVAEPFQCYADSVLITANADAVLYNWNHNNYHYFQEQQSVAVHFDGYYAYRVADENGCMSAFSPRVYVNLNQGPPRPQLSPNSQQEICLNEAIEISGPAVASHESYLWSSGDTTQSITVSEPGAFSLQIIGYMDCVSAPSDTVYVISNGGTIPDPPSIVPSQASTCIGDSLVLAAGGEYHAYEWSNGAYSPSITVTQGGLYQLRVADSIGCQSDWSTAVIPLFVYPPAPSIYWYNDLLASTFTTGCQWYLDGEPIPGATDRFFAPEVSGDYQVEVTRNGCTRISDVFTVTITDTEEAAAEAPIAIYPNPTQDELVLDLSALPSGTRLLLSLHDHAGRQLEERSVEGGALLLYGMQQRPAGLYWLTIHDEAGRLIASEKVIRQ